MTAASPQPDPLDVEALQALCDAATPGPWTTPGPDSIGQWMVYDSEWTVATATAYDHNNALSNRPDARGPGYIDPDANAAFIAAARTALPALLAVLAGRDRTIEAVRARVRRDLVFSGDLLDALDAIRRILDGPQ